LKSRLSESGHQAESEDVDVWTCLKVIKNNKDYYDQSLDEIKLLHYINSHCNPDEKNILKMRDFFYYKEHLVIVTELLCDNLYAFGRYINDSKGQLAPYFTLPRLKRISYQVMIALDYIHSLGLIHCDIKPENIVIKSYSRCQVKLIDFGATCFVTDKLTTYIQSRSYRAPEVVLGGLYDHRIDVWSYGAVLAELYTGYVLFQSDSVACMLARIAGVLGPLPRSLLSACNNTKEYILAENFFYEKSDSDEMRVKVILPKVTSLRERLHIELPVNLADTVLTLDDVKIGLCSSDERDLSLFLDFIRVVLKLDYRHRVSAGDCLLHDWLVDTYSEEQEVLVQYNADNGSNSGKDGGEGSGNGCSDTDDDHDDHDK